MSGGSAVAVGLLVVAVGAVALASKKGESGKAKVDHGGKKPGTISAGGYPEIPSITPEPVMKIALKAGHLYNPSAWDTSRLTDPKAQLYPLAMADEAMLFNPELTDDMKVLSVWLEDKGMGGGHDNADESKASLVAAIDNIINGPVIAETVLEFDKALLDAPQGAQLRAFLFWQWLAGKHNDLKTNLDSEVMAQYPKFRASMRGLLDKTGIKPVKGGGITTTGGGTDFGSLIDPDRPETWMLPDVDGPRNIPTPKGPLFVPENGFIRNGRPGWHVQSGDTGMVISKEWGKNVSWANAIAHENPTEVFGGEKNTVHPGDVLRLPWKFLDPQWKQSYSGSSGQSTSGSGKPGAKQGRPPGAAGDIPPMPTSPAPAGQMWAWTEEEGWHLVPYTPPPPTDSPGEGKYWAWDGSKWVAKDDPLYGTYTGLWPWVPRAVLPALTATRARASVSRIPTPTRTRPGKTPIPPRRVQGLSRFSGACLVCWVCPRKTPRLTSSLPRAR